MTTTFKAGVELDSLIAECLGFKIALRQADDDILMSWYLYSPFEEEWNYLDAKASSDSIETAWSIAIYRGDVPAFSRDLNAASDLPLSDDWYISITIEDYRHSKMASVACVRRGADFYPARSGSWQDIALNYCLVWLEAMWPEKVH